MKHTRITLNYKIQTSQFRNVFGSDDLYNLITVGRLLNAITFARNEGAECQLAKCAVDKETIYLTGGILYNALALSGVMVYIYKDKPYVKDFEYLLEECDRLYLPKVIFDMRYNAPFTIQSNNIIIDEYIKNLNLTGETIILPHVKHGQRSFPIAEIADESEPMRELSDSANNVHQELSSVIGSLIDDFEQAAEEFLFSLSKDIGLKPAEQKHPKVIKV